MTSQSEQALRIEVGEFALAALEAEAARQQTSPEELARHAILYYLADLDSGRVARRVPRGPRRAPGGSSSRAQPDGAA